MRRTPLFLGTGVVLFCLAAMGKAFPSEQEFFYDPKLLPYYVESAFIWGQLPSYDWRFSLNNASISITAPGSTPPPPPPPPPEPKSGNSPNFSFSAHVGRMPIAFLNVETLDYVCPCTPDQFLPSQEHWGRHFELNSVGCSKFPELFWRFMY